MISKTAKLNLTKLLAETVKLVRTGAPKSSLNPSQNQRENKINKSKTASWTKPKIT